MWVRLKTLKHLGQPKDFLTGTSLYLDSILRKEPARLAKGANIVGNVLIDATARIGQGCKIGPDVTIGPGVIIDDGVRLSKCVLLRESHIKNVSLAIPNTLLTQIECLGTRFHCRMVFFNRQMGAY